MLVASPLKIFSTLRFNNTKKHRIWDILTYNFFNKQFKAQPKTQRNYSKTLSTNYKQKPFLLWSSRPGYDYDITKYNFILINFTLINNLNEIFLLFHQFLANLISFTQQFNYTLLPVYENYFKIDLLNILKNGTSNKHTLLFGTVRR